MRNRLGTTEVSWRTGARLLVGVIVLVAFLGQSGAQAPTASPQPAKDKLGAIRPGDVLDIRLTGVPPAFELNGLYTVEPTGKVPLGIVVGRFHVAGLTFEEFERALVERFRNPPYNLKDPLALVTAPGTIRPHEPKDRPSLEQRLDQIEKQWREMSSNLRAAIDRTPPARPARIRPGDSLELAVTGVPPKWAIDGIYTVEPSGKVPLGSHLGRITIAGLTLEEAEAALVKFFSDLGNLPEVKASVMVPGTIRPHSARERPELEQRLEQIEKQLREIRTSLGVITGARQK